MAPARCSTASSSSPTCRWRTRTNIVAGNARVVRPRLSDARFFFEQDKKTPLEARIRSLAPVVYHNKLGSQLERVERLEALAGGDRRPTRTPTSLLQARRAALLAKADLVTDMVGEFPELQGIMGRYYALADGEGRSWPMRFSSPLPAALRRRRTAQAGNVACAVALADKLDALVGFFGIGQIPTGDKDPFALRRAALGVLRILMEAPLPLSCQADRGRRRRLRAGVLSGEGFAAQLQDFMFERLRTCCASRPRRRGDRRRAGA
jgi:glycyl-tRNA synthetase beta chain